jgi:N6-adenosine-specific RNA methylase IME4
MTSFIAPGFFDECRLTAWPFGDLAPLSYDFLMCDPPWMFETYSEKGDEKGPAPHYDMMADAAILALPVGDLARENAAIWLWCTWPKLALGMACLKRWGFTYKTGGAWHKQRWGTGYIWRSACEPVLIGTRGAPKLDGRAIANHFSEPAREHSRKPEIAYAAAEKMMPHARRVSLFERRTRAGWDAWGDGVGVTPGRQRAKRPKEMPPILAAIEGSQDL